MTQHSLQFIFNYSVLPSSNDAFTTHFSQWRILLVEDVEILAKAAQFMLQKTIPQIDWAKTAREAHTLLHQNTYELILLDLGLPDMDGLELAKLIREEPRWNSVRIIVLTAQGDGAHRAMARQIGLNGFLQKPITSALCQNLFSWLASEESMDGFFTG